MLIEGVTPCNIRTYSSNKQAKNGGEKAKMLKENVDRDDLYFYLQKRG
ncbi:hypothetical protein AGMMS49928_23250 [Spirochaetia bacterium]|nr:hypothetical protein AGMMS49928_23250 [Spirochaetia bacterium]